MSRVELHGIAKRFGDHAAVQDVNLVAEAGEFVALLGPSGCGKSTTLRLIAALEQPDAGRIVIGGVDVTRAPAAQRGIAMVFQNYALFPHLTVAENIVFGLTVRRVDKAERARRLAHTAELLGLQALLDRKPSQLSGGQRQRVALGRAIVAQAPVCLMDEPLSNLDAQLRQQMRSEIRELQQRLGITMIYVTHDQTEAMTMADRVVLMRSGRIEQQGTPQDLYERPASTFVAGFIGAPAMNLFPAPHGEALWGVRPEQMLLRAANEGLPARVVAVEYLGAESLLICETGSARVVLRVGGHDLPRKGDTVGLGWPDAALHPFDRDSGLRLPQP
ncbi:ABC transporter ATP-binding protein [Hydrogenophaga sp.]|uniref:ABC transporter ATP-binding protein n=1 Tax=Hydrogenophaga sp. TaxID=1904254 RepID=UPI002FC82307